MSYASYGEMQAARPSGRRRHRRSFFGKMILQIEIEHPIPAYPRPPQPPGEKYDPWRFGSFTFWRDATADDLAVVECHSRDAVAA
jgi:hypothetical protein